MVEITLLMGCSSSFILLHTLVVCLTFSCAAIRLSRMTGLPESSFLLSTIILSFVFLVGVEEPDVEPAFVFFD